MRTILFVVLVAWTSNFSHGLDIIAPSGKYHYPGKLTLFREDGAKLEIRNLLGGTWNATTNDPPGGYGFGGEVSVPGHNPIAFGAGLGWKDSPMVGRDDWAGLRYWAHGIKPMPFSEFSLLYIAGQNAIFQPKAEAIYAHALEITSMDLSYIGSIADPPVDISWANGTYSNPTWLYPPTLNQGDLNEDGTVDGLDAGIMFGHWTGDSVPASVPEPNFGFVLPLIGLFGLRAANLIHNHLHSPVNGR